MTQPSATEPFWRTKKLRDLTPAEWESLCDGCGKCCLHKLREEDTGELSVTNVVCRLMDLKTCRCTRYAERKRLVPDCVQLTSRNVRRLSWMPSTCAYRLVARGEDLPAWHPLKTGRTDSVHEAGISVRGRVISERAAGPLEHHIIDWPGF